ncbi:MAG TPA: nucleoside triphosphate pyrophosphatase [Spirochaetota bacterium]|nr:nucleoside triphosphate pyrophosphatase [Spirochaetota bacterium]
MRVILGSSSPRRKELLRDIFDDFSVMSPDADETPLPGEAPEAYAARVAADKMRSLAPLVESGPEGTLVITGDTIVTIGGMIIGKPSGFDDALSILGRLSGRTHQVISAITLGLWRAGDGRGRYVTATGIERSDITFKPLDAPSLVAYLGRIEYLDKAGAYAAQEHGGMIIERVEGSVSNVIGFPLRLFYKMLVESGAGELLLHGPDGTPRTRGAAANP